MVSIDELLELKLHDQNLKKILLDCEASLVVLTVEIFDDSLQSYKEVLLSFKNVSELYFSGGMQRLLEAEINGFQLYKRSANKNHFEITMISEPGGPSWMLSFDFEYLG